MQLFSLGPDATLVLFYTLHKNQISSKTNRKKKNRRKRKSLKHSVTNTNSTVTNTVVNISNLELTDAEIKLLSKGLFLSLSKNIRQRKA